jgi:D-cysteine desulfhydrase
VQRIVTICENDVAGYHLDIDFVRERDIEIIDGYVGRGCALSQPEELKLLREVAQAEGIFLDPVYTGKAFYGMVEELKRDSTCFGERIIFILTGGIFGLFPKVEELEPIL